MNELADKITNITKLKSGIKRLTLTEFRNYQSLRISPSLNSVVITGANGSGKTNILEAISLLSPGKGLRGAKLSEFKRIKADNNIPDIFPLTWSIAADILCKNEEFTIGTAMQNISKDKDNEVSHSIDRRVIQINQQKLTQQSELGKYISVIWLTPQMERLFLGGTQPRRNFLDRLVYAFDLEHAKRVHAEHVHRCHDDRDDHDRAADLREAHE